MRTEQEIAILVKKFEVDMVDRTRMFRFILVIDQMFNVIWLNGSQDETISSHLARKRADGTITWFQSKVCSFLRKLESRHCLKSLGE